MWELVNAFTALEGSIFLKKESSAAVQTFKTQLTELKY